MEEESVLPPMTGQPMQTQEKSHDMPGVITVTGESGEHVLARIEPMDKYERQSTVDMVLVQVCSMLDANGTLPGIQASCMCLKNQYGTTLSPTAAIYFGQTVRLHGNKGKEEEEEEKEPGLHQVIVVYRYAEYTMHVGDPTDKDIILITACENLNLNAGDHVLDLIDGFFTLRIRTVPSAVSDDMDARFTHSIPLGSLTVKVPHLGREVRIPFYAFKTRRWAIVTASGMMNFALDDVSWDTAHDSAAIFDREVIVLFAKEHPDKRQRLTEEGADDLKYCFITLPDGVTQKRILFKWQTIRASVLMRLFCKKMDMNPEAFRFEGYDTDIAPVFAGDELKMIKR